MAKRCMISGKSPLVANAVSHSNHKTKYRQNPNLQWKRFWLAEENRWVRLRVSTKMIKTINKFGLLDTLRRYNTTVAALV